MTYDEAIAFFRTQKRLSRALGVGQAAVSGWRRMIPARYQYQLEVITDGALRTDAPLRQYAYPLDPPRERDQRKAALETAAGGMA